MKAMSEDGVKFVNIEPLDIIDGNPKLILAFVWHIILFYQIGNLSLSVNSESSKNPANPKKTEHNLVDPKKTQHDSNRLWEKNNRHATTAKSQEKTHSLTPRYLLLKLINGLIPNSRVYNLTSDWNSGKALAALVETFSPGTCPSYSQWNDKNSLLNTTTALCLAEVHLGVPVLIDPNHMTSKNIDELSMITYLSSFTKDGGVAEKFFIQKLSEKFPTIMNNLSNMTTDWNSGVLLSKILKECHPEALKYGFFDGFETLDPNSPQYRQYCVGNIKQAMQDAKIFLNIESSIEPELFASKNVPALAIMSYMAPFLHLNPFKSDEKFSSDDICLKLESNEDHYVGHVVNLILTCNKTNIPKNRLNICIRNNLDLNKEVKYTTEWLNERECHLKFTPIEIGDFCIKITLNDINIQNSPVILKVYDPIFRFSDVKIENLNKESYNIGEFVKFIAFLKRPMGAISCFLEVPIAIIRRIGIQHIQALQLRSYSNVRAGNQNIL